MPSSRNSFLTTFRGYTRSSEIPNKKSADVRLPWKVDRRIGLCLWLRHGVGRRIVSLRRWFFDRRRLTMRWPRLLRSQISVFIKQWKPPDVIRPLSDGSFAALSNQFLIETVG